MRSALHPERSVLRGEETQERPCEGRSRDGRCGRQPRDAHLQRLEEAEDPPPEAPESGRPCPHLDLDLWLPGPGGMSFRGLLSLLRRPRGTRRLHMGEGGARAWRGPATCAGGRGSHHLCPREARTGRHSVSVRAKTWSPVWHLGPQRRRPSSPSLRQKPHLPAVGVGGGPEVLNTPPSINQCFPKPGHVGCAYETTLCGLGWAFFILTAVCLFLWLPSIYGRGAGFLLTEDGEFLSGQTGMLVGGSWWRQ